MSVRIGTIGPKNDEDAVCGVYSSRAGVEVSSDPEMLLTPVQARNLAALLVRAADEVERMRAKPREEEDPPGSRPGGRTPCTCPQPTEAYIHGHEPACPESTEGKARARVGRTDWGSAPGDDDGDASPGDDGCP